MSTRTWHKGPPPHIGWYEASYSKNEGNWRWWDGNTWSVATYYAFGAPQAGICAKAPLSKYSSREVLYTLYWPKNARVPRIDPRVK